MHCNYKSIKFSQGIADIVDGEENHTEVPFVSLDEVENMLRDTVLSYHHLKS